MVGRSVLASRSLKSQGAARRCSIVGRPEKQPERPLCGSNGAPHKAGERLGDFLC